jgi:predicted Rdx family selenoprotein
VPGADVDLVASDAGTFNVVADGVEYWNKHQRGGFPNQDEFVRYLAYKLKHKR